MHRVFIAAVAFLATVQAWGQAPEPDHVCVRDIARWVTFRKPESVRVMSMSGPTAEAIEYSGTRLMAYRFTLMISVEDEKGGYSVARPYTCFTSEDRQRVLNYNPRGG